MYIVEYNSDINQNEKQDLCLYGEWQTCPYKPPKAINGIVPRNGYGNVDLFTPAMIPTGCVHLTQSNAHKAAKNTGVDFAAATVGFDSHRGRCYPVFNGIIICSEFLSIVVEEMNKIKSIEERLKTQRMKAKTRKLWFLLIKGLLIHHKLKSK
ncbi:hypothetical protein GJ496_009649 [Pomphorhynchus laevis]|nr:hypothetical protein GJ496_009649 [Pomphorhynchus laevis]